MADTKKGGNSIVWDWREVDVRNCTCMSVEAGMYCGTIPVPDGEPPLSGSCGSKCWDLGYIDAETKEFISKGLPICGGLNKPPTPLALTWPEFSGLNSFPKGVPACQERATSQELKNTNKYVLQIMGNGSNPVPRPTPGPVTDCLTQYTKDNAAAAKALAGCIDTANKALTSDLNGCMAKPGSTPAEREYCRDLATKKHRLKLTGDTDGNCDSCCRGTATGCNPSAGWTDSCDGKYDSATKDAKRKFETCFDNSSAQNQPKALMVAGNGRDDWYSPFNVCTESCGGKCADGKRPTGQNYNDCMDTCIINCVNDRTTGPGPDGTRDLTGSGPGGTRDLGFWEQFMKSFSIS